MTEIGFSAVAVDALCTAATCRVLDTADSVAVATVHAMRTPVSSERGGVSQVLKVVVMS